MLEFLKSDDYRRRSGATVVIQLGDGISASREFLGELDVCGHPLCQCNDVHATFSCGAEKFTFVLDTVSERWARGVTKGYANELFAEQVIKVVLVKTRTEILRFGKVA